MSDDDYILPKNPLALFSDDELKYELSRRYNALLILGQKDVGDDSSQFHSDYYGGEFNAIGMAHHFIIKKSAVIR